MNTLLTPFVTPLGMVGLLAVMYTLYILANLSQRLGAVTKITPYYRVFYVAIALLAVALLARVSLGSMVLSQVPGTDLSGTSPVTLVAYHVPFAGAMTVSVAIAWRYWSWLFKEKLQ